MSSLRIELERDPPRFATSEQVRGTVVLEADLELRCERLWVRLRWRTQGRGSEQLGHEASHRECFRDLGRCPTRGCRRGLRVRGAERGR